MKLKKVLAAAMAVTMLGSLEKPDEVEGMLGKMIMDAMEEYIAEHAENSKIDSEWKIRSTR